MVFHKCMSTFAGVALPVTIHQVNSIETVTSHIFTTELLKYRDYYDWYD